MKMQSLLAGVAAVGLLAGAALAQEKPRDSSGAPQPTAEPMRPSTAAPPPAPDPNPAAPPRTEGMAPAPPPPAPDPSPPR